MMNCVTMQPDGRLVLDSGAAANDPLPCLGNQLKLSDDCTLRSVFRLFEIHDVLLRLGAFYPALLDQYRQCPQNGCRWDTFEVLQLSKTVEMVGFPGKPRLDIYTVLRGTGKGQDVDIRPLAMEFLLDMPLRLGRLKHVVFGDRVDTLSFETMFTLFEFIDSIGWELSFHNVPAQCTL